MTNYCPICKSTSIKDIESEATLHCMHCDTTLGSPITINVNFAPQQVFLSYGHDSNTPLVEAVRQAVESAGHSVWIDKAEIKFTDDWRAAITEGILKSDTMLSFLSKHSTRPGVCLNEIGIALAHKQGAIATVLAEPIEEIRPPPHVSSKQWLDMSEWRSFWSLSNGGWTDQGAWFSEKVEQILEAITRKKQFAGDLQLLQEMLRPLPLSSKIAALLGKEFVGRQWLFDDIEHWRINAQDQRLLWITADAGMGKSALMARLSFLAKGTVLGVHFCEFDQPTTCQAGALIKTLSFQLAARLPDYRTLLLKTLRYLDKKLSDLNADELFEQLLLYPLGNSIDGGQESFLVLIDALDESEPQLADMLSRMASRLPKQISLVVSSRPDSPLLSRFSGFARLQITMEDARNKSDLETYVNQWLDRLNKKGLAFISAAATKKRLLERSDGNILYLAQANEAQKIGIFDINNIDQFPLGLSGLYTEWFIRIFSSVPQDNLSWKKVYYLLELVTTSPLPLPQELACKWLNWRGQDKILIPSTLGSLLRSENELFTLYHRSLTEWLQSSYAGVFWVNPHAGQQNLAKFLWSCLPQELGKDNLEYGPFAFAMLLPKLTIEDQKTLVSQKNCSGSVKLLQNLAKRLDGVPTIELRAVKLQFLETCTRLAVALLGADHIDTLSIQSDFARALYARGNLTEAQKIQQNITSLRNDILGNNHLDTLTSLFDLGKTLFALNELEGAHAYQYFALRGRAEVLGVNHLDTLSCKEDLALTCFNQMRFDEARNLLKYVLAARAALLGEEHPETLNSKGILAEFILQEGNSTDARVLQESLIESYIKIFGVENSKTLNMQAALALTLSKQGEKTRARELQEYVLAILSRTLEADHPDILDLKDYLSLTLFELGESAKSRKLVESVLIARTRIFGGEHTKTLTTLGNLATILSVQGDLVGAERLRLEVATATAKMPYGVHPDLLYRAKHFSRVICGKEGIANEKAHPQPISQLFKIAKMAIGKIFFIKVKRRGHSPDELINGVFDHVKFRK